MTDLKPEDTLLSVTAELGQQYDVWKSGEREKNKQKDKFFKLVNQHLETETLAEQIITVRAGNEDEARELAGRLYPKWTVEDLRIDVGGHSDHEDGHQWEVIIKENPEYKAYSFVNPDDGRVYQRQVPSGSIMLDDERLQERDPELWLAVSTIPNREAIEGVMYECGCEPDEIADKLDRLWSGERSLIPFEELDPDTLARLGEYIYEGKPTVKLPAPRKAKEEELASSSEV